jgi:aryl-alcohol dehydrogenase-like predicted oxidoreductase
MEKLKDEGKIRQWGVSLGPAIGWREEGFKALADHNAKAVQTVYNLFEQHPGREFCDMARAHGAGVLARVHDNSSILKDKVKIDTTISENDHRKFRDDNWKVYGLQKLEKVRPLAQKYGVHVHTFACKWLLMDPVLTSITGTFLDETEIKEAVAATTMPDLTQQEMFDLAQGYATDFNLGEGAHPCDLKSSTDPSGRVRSNYVPPPVLMA